MQDSPRPPYTERGLFRPGHAACGGCAEALAMRIILNEIGPDAVGVVAPSCAAIILGGTPCSSARIPFIHGLIETAAAMGTGLRRALDARGRQATAVLCLAGDGGSYDIGLQALSSAAERNENILYVCFDNEGYMNTGGQKSSATPAGAATGSTPLGKATAKKNLVEIMAAHRIPYIATATPADPADLAAKIRKARQIRGMKMLIVLIPCLPGWGLVEDAALRVARLAVESGAFALLEISDGVAYRLQSEPRQPIDAYLEAQKRYRHLDRPARAALQGQIERHWRRLRALAGIGRSESDGAGGDPD